jgi:porphobilinogen synthase
MALLHAQAGVDYIAPSDMMDGRVEALRKALDKRGFVQTGILAYSAKYASSLYAPFRDVLQSTLQFGDKRSYQLDPRNRKEALLETLLDLDEGADMVMVKPALHYLDIIYEIETRTLRPVVGYHVSGEYAMVMAAHEKGWLDATAVFLEALIAIKRAGASLIISYAIPQILHPMSSRFTKSLS